MQFNLFTWIREGVRRSVMLGVADAIETVGTPPAGSELNKSLQNFLSRIETPLETAPAIAAKPSAGAPRKRLGRTLRDMDLANE